MDAVCRRTGLLSERTAELARRSNAEAYASLRDECVAARPASRVRCSSAPSLEPLWQAPEKGLRRRSSLPWLGSKDSPRQLWVADMTHRDPEVLEWAGGLSAAAVVSNRQDGGPSSATRRENMKTQWYNMQLERGEDNSTRPPSEALARPALSRSTTLRAQAFSECATAVDGLIEDLTKGARLQHLLPARPRAPDAEEVRLERRRQRAELRRFRRKLRDARDPKRKVELKVESKRRADQDWAGSGSPDKTEIPMQKVAFLGSKGVQQVSLVDVRSLRSRCQQLEGGVTVRSLLELQRNQAKQQRMAAAGKSSLQTSTSLPALTSPA
mmetsp:Transcript_8602/g.14787  ORF Transcript_8602/g.14787 Transcript_8602/m.14787 type:complete len:326 (-) Transcript_8602:33-1010(-)